MRIITSLGKRLLAQEAIKIRQNIMDEILEEIEQKGLEIEDVLKKARVSENKFLNGALTLTQFIKICFILQISPTYLMSRFYDNHEVVKK
jgi:predicted XRE-type DNA-binding protein